LPPLSLEASPAHGEIAFVLSTPNLVNIGWTEFAQAPCKYHLMEGTMEAKAKELRRMAMDTMLVQKYTTKFIQLMRYVPRYTEAKEQRKHYHMMDLP